MSKSSVSAKDIIQDRRPSPGAKVRPAQPSIHSLVEVAIEVPDLAKAESFYGAFGLELTARGHRLELRGRSGHPRSASAGAPAAATIYEGSRKRLKHITVGACEADLPGLVRRLEAAGVRLIDPPPGVESAPRALWFHDPEGTPVQIAPGEKRTPSACQESWRPEPSGWRHAPPRASTQANPHRLGHCFLFTSDLKLKTTFYCDVLGLGVSDMNDHVSFLHAKHGSDHHVIGLAQSEAPGFHHFSWEVANIDQIGIGGQAMADLGYGGWGFGRHVAGSNWFWYVRDPFGGWSEYFCDIDYLPPGTEVPRRELAPEDSVYLWGPPMPEDFIINSEAQQR